MLSDGVQLSSHLQHELAVVPADKDHFPGETVASPPAAHQEPRGHAHLCNLLRPLEQQHLLPQIENNKKKINHDSVGENQIQKKETT